MQNKISQNLKQAIDKSGLTLIELEKKTNISKSAIQRYASGITDKIPIDAVMAIADVTNVPAMELMGWNDANTIAERLSNYINQGNINVVSSATKLSVRSITSWMEGKKEPNIGQAKKIADYFDIRLSDLIGEGYQPKNSITVPVLGKVIAGVPIEAIEDIIDYEEIDTEMAKDGEYFALQISGDSMEPKFTEGDIVIVRKQASIESGQIAIVRVNGNDATVKKVVVNDSGITLVPFNNAYDPIYYSRVDIQKLPVEIAGRVVELRAKF